MAIKNFAQEVFRSDGDQLLVPRQKFNFTLILDIYNRPSVTFHRVSSVQLSPITFETDLAMQYNVRRAITKRISYGNFTVSFYDTYDNEWTNILREYTAHYFHKGHGFMERPYSEGSSTVTPVLHTDKGFTPNSVRNYFPQIRIIQNGYRGKYREIIYINPKIIDVNLDTLDYSSSSPVIHTVNFQPESMQIKDVASQFDDGIE